MDFFSSRPWVSKKVSGFSSGRFISRWCFMNWVQFALRLCDNFNFLFFFLFFFMLFQIGEFCNLGVFFFLWILISLSLEEVHPFDF